MDDQSLIKYWKYSLLYDDSNKRNKNYFWIILRMECSTAIPFTPEDPTLVDLERHVSNLKEKAEELFSDEIFHLYKLFILKVKMLDTLS